MKDLPSGSHSVPLPINLPLIWRTKASAVFVSMSRVPSSRRDSLLAKVAEPEKRAKWDLPADFALGPGWRTFRVTHRAHPCQRTLLMDPGSLTDGRDDIPSPSLPPSPPHASLRAVHTPNLPDLLRRLGASLLVTTYQAGKLVMIRDEGDHLNTHFRTFQAPMGLALFGDRLAIGTSTQVWEFVNVPAVSAKLEPPGRHDACFLPRSSHFTGNVLIHEMAYGSGEELWFVNTRFSCLCTIDRSASFTPRWRPPFVTALEPTDRCHLNGLAMVDGQPRYVTALGQTDAPAGWRDKKAQGGILMDIATGELVATGLSMPHSPRFHAGRLWVCESGAGTLGYIDPTTRRYEPVAATPGFTRGLDFAGNLAFVGLSQVRESAVFSGIPIAERLKPEERTCGVCVIDLTRGEPIALVRFEEGVQEIFAVQVLRGRQYPELVNDDAKLLENSFVVPDAALADVPAALCRHQPSRSRDPPETDKQGEGHSRPVAFLRGHSLGSPIKSDTVVRKVWSWKLLLVR